MYKKRAEESKAAVEKETRTKDEAEQKAKDCKIQRKIDR